MSETVIVEAITHYEVIGNLFAAITDVELHLQFAWLEQERTDVNALGVLLLKRVEHVSHGEACIDDVFDDDDGSACYVNVEANHLTNAASRVCAFVASQLDEGNLARQVNLSKQVGCKDERTVQNSQEDWLLAFVVAVDLVGNTLYLTFDCALGYSYCEGFVLYLNDSASLHNL